jgi:hypothetical protein
VAFHSILFETPDDGPPSAAVSEPTFFGDLNLDQFVREVTRGYDEYRLEPFFRTELKRESAIAYRQQVMRDLDGAAVQQSIHAFALDMRKMRASLEQADKLYYARQKQWWFHEAASRYSQAVRTFCSELRDALPASRGLTEFVVWLGRYVQSEAFAKLDRDLQAVKVALASVRYCIRIDGNAVTVLDYDGEPDYSAYVLDIFDRFKQGEVKDRSVGQKDYPEMNHVEAQILDFVAELQPGPFALLADFRSNHAEYLDPVVAAFDREIEFYLAYRNYMQPCLDAGLAFSYPLVSSQTKAIRCTKTFDLVLAHKLCADKADVVCNDMGLNGPERIFVVSGPNNGGKTTFARTFGQLHFLGRLGCPVPGLDSRLFLYDQLFAHFEREENTQDLRGKLQDDLMRMHDILQRSTSSSIILMNEIFSSTTLADALFLCRRIIGEIMEREALCVCVTFIEELATLGPQTVSVVSEIDSVDPSIRTFRVKRQRADGRAYAISVAERYGLTYQRLKERLAS